MDIISGLIITFVFILGQHSAPKPKPVETEQQKIERLETELNQLKNKGK